jgi:hypothetical protein
MTQLAMTALHAHDDPTIAFQPLEHIPDVHPDMINHPAKSMRQSIVVMIRRNQSLQISSRDERIRSLFTQTGTASSSE